MQPTLADPANWQGRGQNWPNNENGSLAKWWPKSVVNTEPAMKKSSQNSLWPIWQSRGSASVHQGFHKTQTGHHQVLAEQAGYEESL